MRYQSNTGRIISKNGLIINPVFKFKKTHTDAQLPTCSRDCINTGDTGYDLIAVEDVQISRCGIVPVGLTLAYVQPGFWFRIEPRSGLGFKHDIQPHLGVIDNEYRGDLGVKLYNFGHKPYFVKKGDRVAQMIAYPLLKPQMEWADEIEDSSRGDSGFGSSGK